VAHDLNNLLTISVNYTAVLEDEQGDAPGDTFEECLFGLQASNEQASRLVQLLAFGRRNPSQGPRPGVGDHRDRPAENRRWSIVLEQRR